MACGSDVDLFSDGEQPYVMRTSGSSDEEDRDPTRDREPDMSLFFQPLKRKHAATYPKTRKARALPYTRASTDSRSDGTRNTHLDVTPKSHISSVPIPSYGNEELEVVSVLREMTSTLNKLVKRVESTENGLKTMQHKLEQSQTASSGESTTVKDSVPLIVRAETRKIYQTLIDDDDEFTGFDVGINVTFKDEQNRRVLQTLLKEVKAANPSFQTRHIRSAAYTYYKSLNQDASLKRRGKLDERKKARRRRERLTRKLQERIATLNKAKLSEKDREKWSKVFVTEMMSSEESDDGDDSPIVVRPLPWRSNRVDNFFSQLDKRNREHKSPQARRQMKERIFGNQSSRPAPCGRDIPEWAFANIA